MIPDEHDRADRLEELSRMALALSSTRRQAPFQHQSRVRGFLPLQLKGRRP
jgi:hypothetical protein